MEIEPSEDTTDIKWLDEVKMEESHAMDNDQGGVGSHTWMIILHHMLMMMKMEAGCSCGHHRHGDRMECTREMHICK